MKGQVKVLTLKTVFCIPSTAERRSLSTALMYRVGPDAQHCHTPYKILGSQMCKARQQTISFLKQLLKEKKGKSALLQFAMHAEETKTMSKIEP